MISKSIFFLHSFAADNARAELSCKPNTIKLALIVEVPPIMHDGLKAQKRVAQGKRSDPLGQRQVSQ